jgi:eukaryotic-like serine/threonine-protein kinase
VKQTFADKYELVGVLGEGMSGIVYDAIPLSGGSNIALKVMHETLAGDIQLKSRFRREATILRRLGGAHICPILELGEVEGESGTSLLYIALPKIEGESLAELLARGFIDVDRALDLLLQILEALRDAHAVGVIHRDLKPANVLIEDGKKAVVVDFGMSKIVTGSGAGTTNITTHNMLFGTPEYMSPEQARGDELDGRCDVYAAGVILYELLTGKPPFVGPSPLSTLTAHLTADLVPPSERPTASGRVSRSLDAVVVRALARDRDARYPSAEAFAAAIDDARTPANMGPEAFASTLPAVVLHTPKSEPEADAIDSIGSTLVSERSLVPPPTLADPKAAPAPPRGDPTWIAVWVAVAIGSIAVGVYLALRH